MEQPGGTLPSPVPGVSHALSPTDSRAQERRALSQESSPHSPSWEFCFFLQHSGLVCPETIEQETPPSPSHLHLENMVFISQVIEDKRKKTQRACIAGGVGVFVVNNGFFAALRLVQN